MTYRSINALIVAALVAGAAWTWWSRVEAGSNGNPNELPRVGFKAPDFSLSDSQGALISLSDLRGQVVIVNLWTSWCPPCQKEMPALQEVHESYSNQGVVILAVNATNQDDAEAALAFGEELGLTFPILFDYDGQVSEQYRLQSLPTTYFIGTDGTIREIVVGGPMSEALLRVRVQQLLGEG